MAAPAYDFAPLLTALDHLLEAAVAGQGALRAPRVRPRGHALRWTFTQRTHLATPRAADRINADQLWRGAVPPELADLLDADHYLLVPIKQLPGELWLETLYIERKEKFHRRGWAKQGSLYQREAEVEESERSDGRAIPSSVPRRGKWCPIFHLERSQTLYPIVKDREEQSA